MKLIALLIVLAGCALPQTGGDLKLIIKGDGSHGYGYFDIYKFRDEGNDCYVARSASGIGISCVKR